MKSGITNENKGISFKIEFHRESQMKIKGFPLKLNFICGDKQTNKQTNKLLKNQSIELEATRAEWQIFVDRVNSKM